MPGAISKYQNIIDGPQIVVPFVNQSIVLSDEKSSFLSILQPFNRSLPKIFTFLKDETFEMDSAKRTEFIR